MSSAPAPYPTGRATVSFRPARLESLGGLAVPDTEIERILEAQGYAIRDKASANGKETWTVAIPVLARHSISTPTARRTSWKTCCASTATTGSRPSRLCLKASPPAR